MVLRMLRVAIPGLAGRARTRHETEALALLHAVGGFQAYRRAVRHAPTVGPVVRFLLFDSRLSGLGRLLGRRAAAALDRRRRPAALVAAGAAPRPAERRSGAPAPRSGRRRRAGRDARAGPGRARAGRSRHRRTVFCDRRPRRRSPLAHLAADRRYASRMNFAIRYLTEYDYDADVVDNLNALRVKPHGNGRQRCDEFNVRLTPEVRLHRHTDYFGTEVVEFEVSRPHRHLTIDVRARVSTKESVPAAPGHLGGAAGPAATARPAASSCCRPTTRPGNPALAGAAGHHRRRLQPAGHRAARVRADPRPLRVPQGRDLRRLARSTDLLEAGAGVCQDFVHLGLCLLRHHGIAARYVSGYLFAAGSRRRCSESIEVDTHAWLEALLPVPDGGRAGLGRRRPDQPRSSPARPTSRSATAATTPMCRRSRASTAAPPRAKLDASVTMTRLSAPTRRRSPAPERPRTRAGSGLACA